MAASLMILGCHDNDNLEEDNSTAENVPFTLRTHSHSGCKSNTEISKTTARKSAPGNEEYVEYEGRENGYIYICHLNSVFNCGTEKIGVDISLSGDTIHLSERMEEGLYWRCQCPFDVMVDAGPLHDGIYTLIVGKEGKDYAKATITYSATAKEKVKLEPLE